MNLPGCNEPFEDVTSPIKHGDSPASDVSFLGVNHWFPIAVVIKTPCSDLPCLKLTGLPLKITAWNITSFWDILFSEAMLVSGSVPIGFP